HRRDAHRAYRAGQEGRARQADVHPHPRHRQGVRRQRRSPRRGRGIPGGESRHVHGTLWSVLLAVLLLAANGFFVAAEFALVKSKGFRIDALAEQGRWGASLTQHILKHIEAYLACCQLGITMASLGLGWV